MLPSQGRWRASASDAIGTSDACLRICASSVSELLPLLTPTRTPARSMSRASSGSPPGARGKPFSSSRHRRTEIDELRARTAVAFVNDQVELAGAESLEHLVVAREDDRLERDARGFASFAASS
jgi:hypothetical protein